MGFLSALAVYLGVGREQGFGLLKKHRKILAKIRGNTSW